MEGKLQLNEVEEILRGEIYYVRSAYEEGSEQRAGRPAVVVSNDKANKHSPVVEMVYLTTKPKNPLPTHVDILSTTYPSIALCEQIQSISKTRIGQFIAMCSPSEMAMIDGALCVSLGIVFPTERLREQNTETIKSNELEMKNNELQRDVDFWKSLYNGLLDKLVQAKS